MSPLPQSALQELERAQASFSEKPIAAVVTKSLTALEVRKALGNAARAARDDQAPAAVYDPGHGEPLVVLRLEDLVKLLRKSEGESSAEPEGRREP